MLEGYLLGMEVEAGCLLVAIEWVAQDGSIQAFLMSTMYTELVGSAGLWIESETKMSIVDSLQYLILCDGLLALFVVYDLARTV